MTDAKTDMPTLETVVKSWREAPYKPATDDQIEAMRSRLKIEEEYEMPSWNRNSVAILIARIDAERARAVRAEAEAARLRDDLTENLEPIAKAIGFCVKADLAVAATQACDRLRTALTSKEPTNA